MSRHRDIRNMDYSEDYDGYDDIYGHSVDDDYCISPSNRQFIYNRDRLDSLRLSESGIQEAAECDELSDIDKAKLASCIEQINSIVPDSNGVEHNELINLVLKYKFNVEKVVNEILENSKYRKTTPISEKATLPTIVEPTSSTDVKVVTSVKTGTNVIKGFKIPTADSSSYDNQIISAPASIDKLKVSPRSQSPPSGRDTPVFADEEEKGHVDAGKSTLMGKLLCELGQINQKTIHKYEQESKKLGKQSFMYAWVLDETGEERTRGITMDVGKHQFETKSKSVTLLDAPGHKDFIPNMISGAGQADVALLVVDATRGEFETGFEQGGQTREHALLVRSLGVSQLAVAINKLDNVSWSQERFNEIVQKLKNFLKQAGFKENDVTFVPCSGLTGQNLVKKPTENELLSWYNGPCLINIIDNFKSPDRPITKPMRFSVSDIFKGTGSGFCVAGRVETGLINVGDKVLVCPNRELAVAKNLFIDDLSRTVIFAGDQAAITLSGIEMQSLSIGNILCDVTKPVQVSCKFEARIVVFNVTVPITRGFPIVLHHQSLVEPAVISKLQSQLNKSTGEVSKKHPRFLGNNTSAIVEITLSKPIALECYSECKELGRVMLRVGGVTIAAGLITKVIL